jgi:hypothetical protein
MRSHEQDGSGERPRTFPAFSRYEVRGVLGEGATSVVYSAWDRDLHRPVAIKLLRETAGLSDLARLRFRREAQAAAGMAHPNVVTLYDAGEQDGRSPPRSWSGRIPPQPFPRWTRSGRISRKPSNSPPRAGSTGRKRRPRSPVSASGGASRSRSRSIVEVSAGVFPC